MKWLLHKKILAPLCKWWQLWRGRQASFALVQEAREILREKNDRLLQDTLERQDRLAAELDVVRREYDSTRQK